MEIGETVIPNEENEEEDLTRCNPSFLPLPAVRISKGVWLARWTLNEAERRTVAQTGDIYIRMHAIDGDELVMPHRLFVEQPNLQQMKDHFEAMSDQNKNPTIENKDNKKKKEDDLWKPTF